MHILYFLITTLMDFKSNKTSRLLENTKIKQNISLYTVDDINIPTIKNLSREILYEGFISIDSVIFLVSTGIIKEKELDSFIQNTIFTAKKILLLRPGVWKFFNIFSTKIDIENITVRKLIEMRNKIFDLDKSQIALSLTRDKILELEKRAQNKLVLMEDKKNKAYLHMIKALYKSRDGEDGLAVNLSKERFEFYRENVILSKEQIQEAKIFINLGGAIFSPALLLPLCRRLTIYKKKEIVKKSISAFLEPLDILHETIVNRSFMDKKKQIIEYLISCLKMRNNNFRQKIDNAFYYRSILIEHFIRENGIDDELYKTLDAHQEKEIKKIIYIFENMDEYQIRHVIVHDRRILELYLNYLCDGQETTKNKLFNIFTDQL